MEAPELQSLIDGVRDVITVKRVYADPYEKNGLTVIPAAAVRGGGGGGNGHRGEGESGSGGGLGMTARPSGAWVIKDGQVSWKSALDVNRVILGAQMVALAVTLVGARRVRSKHDRTPIGRLPGLAERRVACTRRGRRGVARAMR